MTYLLSIITPNVAWTRLIAFFPQEMYLGAKVKKKIFDDGTSAWRLSPSKYVQQAVKNVETFLKTNLDGRY
jgi:hypothetical protein